MVLEKYAYSTIAPGSPDYLDYLALRHEVFCDELQRVPSARRKGGGLALESDEYDVHSLHVLCRSVESGLPVACSRLILPGPNGLSIGARYAIEHRPAEKPLRVGEIGRLALSQRLRRCRSANSSGAGRIRLGAEDRGSAQGQWRSKTGLRDGPSVALGMYREIFRLAGAYGITHCYAAMEPSFARLLNRLGFPFHEAGPLNTAVHPARQPYMIGAQEVRSGLASRNSCLYQFMFGAAERMVPAAAAARVPAPHPAAPPTLGSQLGGLGAGPLAQHAFHSQPSHQPGPGGHFERPRYRN